ncbi:MAG: sodium:proton antiporter, partial [Coriobacteriaceae bacterium]|nr:sodium:proton antiporter [Coriobacteriaceae bacterium]
MEAFELILLLLAAVILSSVIDQMVPKVSSPLIQIALGLLIALFSLSPVKIVVDPEFFLILFIAPLLFYEAKKANKVSLWKNKKPVVSLAVGLVVATVLIVGFYVNWLIPSIPLAAAFALGAALGPTDAVAVSALSKETSLSPRQKSLLAGESLINDASGIVSFQFAIAAVITGTFSLIDASVSFFVSFFGGIIVGLVIAWVANFALRKARARGLESTTFHVLFELFMPFIVYLAAHFVGVSGILAVVAAGLVMGVSPRGITPSISRLNIVSDSAWQVLSFTLNGVVFVLLGAQLPTAMADTWESIQTDNLLLIGEVLFITFMLLVTRFVWILVMERLEARHLEKKAQRDNERSQDAQSKQGPLHGRHQQAPGTQEAQTAQGDRSMALGAREGSMTTGGLEGAVASSSIGQVVTLGAHAKPQVPTEEAVPSPAPNQQPPEQPHHRLSKQDLLSALVTTL